MTNAEMTDASWAEFINEAADYFDRMNTAGGLQSECDNLAAILEDIAYEEDFEAVLDFFSADIGGCTRETSEGEFESELVYLAFGGPTIELDTATGEIFGRWGGNKHGAAKLSKRATYYVNDFFRMLHNC